MDNTTVDKPESEIKNEASQELDSPEQAMIKPEQAIPLAPDLSSPEVLSITEKEPQAQPDLVYESPQPATLPEETTPNQPVQEVSPVIEAPPRIISPLSVEKQLSEILENKDFSKESPRDALEQILNSSESGS